MGCGGGEQPGDGAMCMSLERPSALAASSAPASCVAAAGLGDPTDEADSSAADSSSSASSLSGPSGGAPSSPPSPGTREEHSVRHSTYR